MSKLKRFHTLLIAAMAMLLAGATSAQEYPSKPIKIIVPGTGNFFDIAARIIAQEITGPLGQPVIVDNRPNGIISAELVAKAAPDGYTLLIGTGTLWLAPYMQEVSFDPIKDFAPITLTTRSPTVLIVHPSLPVKSVKDLMALAKAKPGVLNYATGSTGATGHLAAELFKSMAHIDMVRIGYKGSGPALIDLLAGQVQLMFAVTGSVAPFVKSGKVRAVAITSAQPSPLMPGLPTVAASGLPGFVAVSVAGLLAPARTPPVIINRLQSEISRALKRPDIKDKFLNIGVDTVGSTSEEFATTIKAEMATMGKIIKEQGIRAE